MKKILMLTVFLLLLASLTLFSACGDQTDTTAETTGGTVTTTDGVINQPSDGAVSVSGNTVTVTSLSDKLVMTVEKDDTGAFTYSLATKDGKALIGKSALGLTAGIDDVFDGAVVKGATAKELKVSYKHLGTFSTLTDHGVAATVTLEKGGYEFYLEIKLYDNGVAFRYNLPTTGKMRAVKSEATAFSVLNANKIWYGTKSDCYESVISSISYGSISTSDKLTGPLTVELTGGGYIALMEGYVNTEYIGTCYTATGKDNTFKICGSWTSGKNFDQFTSTGDILTGWRVINYSPDLAGLTTNVNIYHTALGMDGKTTSYTEEEQSFITPGKSVWSWINDRGVPFDPQITYTLNAAKLGFTYNIIDEGYPSWDDYEAKLLELGLLGEANNVKQILWAAVANRNGYRITSREQAQSVMKKIADLHLSGIKLDFFNPESNDMTLDIQEETLKAGMENGLIVNFHGVHKPTAYSVLYPNELTREGIRGLENISRTDLAKHASFFTAQFYTRLLAGHADWTPDVKTAMQIASLIALDSPLMVVATKPEEMLASPALEMIRAIPTVWDQTVLLDGEIGAYISVAKEFNGVWYIGGIVSNKARKAELDLSKLLGDGEYLLTGWVDESTSRMNQMTQVVTKDTKLDLGNIPVACGYVFQITKLSISQYGGEITGPITVKTASATSVVKYTLDGSDPMTSTTAITAGESITLTESALLRIAIVEGDGKGTELSYQFNKVEYNSVECESQHGNAQTTVTLTPTHAGATVYYTLDGSTPTAASTAYTAPIVLTESTTLKVIAITPEGKTSAVKSFKIGVSAAIQSVTPDQYIGSDYTEAKTDWGSIKVDQSMNSTTLSLGGMDQNSGTKFSHGISANANAHFVYTIPENATEFVGVAGIDDSAYKNAKDGHKASAVVKIYIDGNLVHTTALLGQGDYEQIRVTIPEGATTLRIEFGDGGKNGITCDNVSLCDAGYILAK